MEDLGIPNRLHIVMLTDEAVDMMQNGIIGSYLVGRWMIAKSVAQSALLSVCPLLLKNGLHDHNVEVHIPYHYVRYIASSEKKDVLGFAEQK